VISVVQLDGLLNVVDAHKPLPTKLTELASRTPGVGNRLDN